MDWPSYVDKYLSQRNVAEPVAKMLTSFKDRDPLDLTVALDPDHAETYKQDTAGFLVFAIRQAVTDHALTDEQVRGLRQVCRLLRIRESDLLAYRKDEVVELLTQEMERLLEDQSIDPHEALHKVKLQELLGLSYDELLSLTAPQVEKIIHDLMSHLDPLGGQASRSLEWFFDSVAALDTVYDLDESERWAPTVARLLAERPDIDAGSVQDRQNRSSTS